MLNTNGDVFFGFTFSSTDRFPSAGVFGAPGGDLNKISDTGNAIIYHSGTAVYNASNTTGGFNNRWGDYSGAAIDPNDPTAVWIAQEYSGGGDQWGTAITKVFFGP